jgi:lysozyme family protein
MNSSYGATTAFTILQEGGYSDVQEDSGNWSSGEVGIGTFIGSKWGCGAPATIAYLKLVQPNTVVTAAYMQNLPQGVYDGMALTNYWNPLDGDNLPAGLDLSCFDDGWNTGVETSAKLLQAIVGAGQDGFIGPETEGLIQSCTISLVAETLTKPTAALQGQQTGATALQTLLGVAVDGDVGPLTLDALEAQVSKMRVPAILCALYEAQCNYYRGLYNFSQDGNGWLTRASARLTSALKLAVPAT